ncbi:MAG: hypothetical protein LDL19_09960 [Thiobacillus sp.]|nr:hypothetical protein [Thiobacillus sp.]
MTIRGLLFRFALTYFVALLVVGFALHLAGNTPSWLNVGLRAGLFAGVEYFLLSLFSLRNKRAASKTELCLALSGMLAIDFLVNMLGRSSGVDLGVSALAALTASTFHGLCAIPAVISVHGRMTRLFLHTANG